MQPTSTPRSGRTTNLLVLATAVLCGALLGSTWMLGESTMYRLLRKDAEATGTQWARDFARRLTDLEQVLAGASPSPESIEFMESARSLGHVFRFKLFDGQGRQVLVSDQLDAPGAVERLSEHNPKAAAVLSTGEPHSELKSGRPPERPLHFVEAYVPVVVGGRLVAVSEVYVDQTEKLAAYRSELVLATCGLVGMTALAFCMPAAAFFWRTRQKQKADEHITFLAHHDPMTGLTNRASFMQALDRLLGDAEARDLGLAIHYVDVDRFKDVNDTLGHDTGDDLVREIGRRLQAAAGEADVVARIGGDEFALVQRRATRHEEVIAFAERLIARVAEPCVARGHEIAATASIGTLWMPPPDEHRHDPQRDGGVDAVLALKRADIAMYKAKSLGRNRFCVFDPSMDSELQERRRIEQRIRHAVLHDGFDLHFQPLFDASDRSLTGFEALLRLPVGDGTTISPAAFIPVAEDMGLISTIGAGVLLRACEAARHWPEPLRVAVNLSPAQFADGSIVAAVRDALQRSGLAPHRLELEITEGLLLTSTESVMRDLAELKAMGTAIVMDDFGTGYSSLSYLWRFPFDKIKIDRSFIGALNAGDETVRNIVRTIVSLGRSLRMRVTAEGVETDGQANYLSALACDQLQGFLLGRPVPQAEVAALIRETQAQRAIERAAQADRGHPDRGHAEHGHSGHARFPDGHSEPEIPGDANAARRTQSTPV